MESRVPNSPGAFILRADTPVADHKNGVNQYAGRRPTEILPLYSRK